MPVNRRSQDRRPGRVQDRLYKPLLALILALVTYILDRYVLGYGSF